MNAACTTVEFAPMLSILFLAARMRSLQHDSQPQAWAQNCMWFATCAMCATTSLAIAVPLVMGGSMKPNPVYGYFLIAMRYICMLSFYGGAIGVIVSIYAFKADEGPTAPVSPTVQCVVNLTCQFFLVFFMVSAMLTVSEISGGAIQMTQWRLFSAVESA